MIHNPEDAKNLTDAQLIKLMNIVNDDKPIELTLPSSPGESVRLVRAGLEYYIYSNGIYRSMPHPASRVIK